MPVLHKAAFGDSLMFPQGKRILQAVAQFKSRKWPSKDIETLADKIAEFFQERNEIISGGVTIDGEGSDDAVLNVDMTALESVLNGRLMAAVAAATPRDLFATAGSVGQAIYEDGSDASGIELADPSTARVTLILCNSDGAGGASEDDNDAPLLVAVVAGTAAALGAAHLSSQEIQDALEASTDIHDGVTGWAHVCQILWSRAGAAYTVTPTMNRNNVVQGA